MKGQMREILKPGEKHGMLTAIRFDHKDKLNRQVWLFGCDCGNEKIMPASPVKREALRSCGCLQKENVKRAIKVNTRHGMSKTREYRTWRSMRDRCYNPSNRNYANYGFRGIGVCDRWRHSFENFYADMGDIPENKSLDRIDNDTDYSPENCRWATDKEQMNNRRVTRYLTFRNKTLSLSQWSEELGIIRSTLESRLIRGWSIDRAFSNQARRFL